MSQKGKFQPFLGKEGPFGEAASQADKAALAGGYVPEIRGEAVGTLSICIMREPGFEAFSKGLAPSDHYLDLDDFLTGKEWDAIFIGTLHCPDRTYELRQPEESVDEALEKFAVKFKEAIPEYPTLARIWDMFIYVAFQPEEIGLLRNECLSVRGIASDPSALTGIEKLLRACEEASRLHFGFLLVPD
jgi:hypothetical protein